jgi:hypothetical protein
LRVVGTGVYAGINADGTALDPYVGTLEDRFPRLSLFDALNDWALAQEKGQRVLPRGVFKDKVVVVGGSAIGTADMKATPFDPLVPRTTSRLPASSQSPSPSRSSYVPSVSKRMPLSRAHSAGPVPHAPTSHWSPGTNTAVTMSSGNISMIGLPGIGI